MAGLVWGPEQQSRLDAIRDDLAQVSTASACQLLDAAGVAQHLHAGAVAAGTARPRQAARRAGADLPLPDAARAGGAAGSGARAAPPPRSC